MLIAYYWFGTGLTDLLPESWLQDRVGVSVSTPTVHTRERLLNDRFEQVSWLDRELQLTNPPDSGAKPRQPEKPAADGPPPTRDPDPAPPAVGARYNDERTVKYGSGNPLNDFQLMSGYREVLRAERARAMLDDRHDMDGSTLHLLSFDTTVVPEPNATGFAAIEVIVTRDPHDLNKDVAGFQQALNSIEGSKPQDLFDLYVMWLEHIRNLYRQSMAQYTKLIASSDVSRFRDDFEPTLKVDVCVQFLRLQRQGSSVVNEELLKHACEHAIKSAKRAGDTANGIYQEAEQAAAQVDAVLSTSAEALANSRRVAALRVEPISGLDEWISLYARMRAADAANDQRIKGIAELIAQANQNVLTAMQFLSQTGSSCDTNRPTEADRTQRLVPNYLLEDVKDVFPGTDQNLRVVANCGDVATPADQTLLLYALLRNLVESRSRISLDSKVGALPSGLDWVVEFGGQIVLSGSAFRSVDPSCVAAQFLQDTIIRANADEPRNHGASLSEFFDIRVNHLQNFCAIVVEPKIKSLRSDNGGSGQPTSQPDGAEKDCTADREGREKAGLTRSGKDVASICGLLTRLETMLEKTGYSTLPSADAKSVTHAYTYSLSPRLNENRIDQSSTLANATASMAGQGLEFRQRVRAESEGLESTVVGFNRAPSAAEGELSGARFGWLISPQPRSGGQPRLQVIQAQLSAVVAMPSWWRSALLQVCTRYVKPSSVSKVMEAETWSGSADCRTSTIRLPGTASDLSRRLGMDVLTTPYMEEWSDIPIVSAADKSRPAKLLIKGERLWRNTVVTLGGQKADKIEVLPDMSGILATFSCVEVPTVNAKNLMGNLAPLASSSPQPPPPSGGEAQNAPDNSGHLSVALGMPFSTIVLPGGDRSQAKQGAGASDGQKSQAAGTGAGDPGRKADGDKGASAQAGAAGSPASQPPNSVFRQGEVWTVPVIVWTSEGHTNPQPANVVLNGPSQACPSEAGGSAN